MDIFVGYRTSWTMNFRKFDTRFNILFWLTYFIYEWLANASIDNEYRRYFIHASVIVPITLAAAIFTVHVLFKRFYFRNNKSAFWIGLALSMLVFVMTRRAYHYFYVYPIYWPEGLDTIPLLFFPKIIIDAVNIYLIVGVYSTFYLTRAWYEEQRLAQELKQEKTEAELQLLKSQVHPHFIFNTLNNIYSYAIQQNTRTPHLIHRLSSFLSYNLYDSKASSIELRKELDYINSYIELEKIRYGDRLDISMNVFNPINDFHITPMLLLPLIENCFKHGCTHTALEKYWIRIDLSKQNDWLSIKIENSVIAINGHNGTKKGIGLENVKRRLEIIYPGNHEFRCMNGDGSFLTILKVKNLSMVAHVPEPTRKL